MYADVAYIEDDNDLHKLDLYVPAEATAGNLVPLVLYIHGGAFISGSKDGFMLAPCDWFLSAGFAVCSADFRLAPADPFPAQVEDLKAVVRWLRAHAAEYNIDPNRFASIGWSSGGHLSAMLGCTGQTTVFDVGENLDQSSALQACIEFSGPTDFAVMDSQRLPEGATHDEAESVESMYIGGALQESLETCARANPINYITPQCTPFLVSHGDNDHSIPYGQGVILVAALREAAVPVSFFTVVGADHEQQTFAKCVELWGLVRLFLSRHLTPGARCLP